MNKAKSF